MICRHQSTCRAVHNDGYVSSKIKARRLLSTIVTLPIDPRPDIEACIFDLLIQLQRVHRPKPPFLTLSLCYHEFCQISVFFRGSRPDSDIFIQSVIPERIQYTSDIQAIRIRITKSSSAPVRSATLRFSLLFSATGLGKGRLERNSTGTRAAS